MDDRDKDLTHLFVRDLDEIPLPARGEWRRAPGRETIAMRSSRYLLTAGAVVAVLAIALIVGLQLNQRQQTAVNPSASPTQSPTDTSLPFVDPRASASPSATAASSGATATPAAGSAIYNDDFGFLVATGDVPAENVVKESGGAPLGTITSVTVAVSPDGKQVAFFVPTVNAATLQIAPASDPSKAQTVATLGVGEQGAGVVWSNDATGLLFASVFQKPDGSVQSSQVHTVDLRGTTLTNRLIFAQPSGFIFRPIAWDRAANVAAFGETGDGGFMASYDVANLTGADPNVTSSKVPVRITMASVTASSDAKFVVGQDLDANGFTYWPLQTMSGAGRHPPESKYGANGFAWRPGTHEIGFIGPSNQFWVCDVDKDTGQQVGTCGRTLFSGVPDGAFVRFFRADGSAVLLALRAAPGPGPTSWLLVRIGTDPKSTSGDRVTFQVPTAVLGSVRLQ